MPTAQPGASRIWRNWAGTHRRTPVSWDEPESVAELRRLLRRPGRVKVVGSGHSFSAIAAPEERLVSLRRLRRVLAVEPDRITVEAGARLKDVQAALVAHGRSLDVLGTAADQTVAGAIATATHGTGGRIGNLSTLVLGLDLLTADGELLRVDEASELLPAARAHLGALGVVTAVTLRSRPAFRLRELARPTSLGAVLGELEELLERRRHFKLWWWPHTEEVRSWEYDETDEPPGPRSRLYDARSHAASYAAWAAIAAATRVPAALPALARAVVPRANRRRERVAEAQRVFNHPVPMPHDELEYAVDRADARRAVEALREAIERGRHAVDFLVEVRFAAGDDVWLSPAYGRETCYVGAFMLRERGREAYFRDAEAALCALGGRPHWGKSSFVDADYLAGVYPMWERFLALRAELDPRGVFLNRHLERVLGL